MEISLEINYLEIKTILTDNKDKIVLENGVYFD